MTGTDIMTHCDIMLRPDPARTVLRPFDVGDPEPFADPAESRAQRTVDAILALDGRAARRELSRVLIALKHRHGDVEDALLRRFAEIPDLTIDRAGIPRDHALLIGAYFSEEYSFEAAALFNPSMVLHPDQDGAPEGGLRFLLSLRGIGEGHVSSVTFRTGSWVPGGAVTVDPACPTVVTPRIESMDGDDGAARFRWPGGTDPSGTVLFPTTPAQRQGIEDMRLVRFTDDDGSVHYYGTYTAFSGSDARCELLISGGGRGDLMEMRPLTGSAAANKGLALFPRRIDGRYAMLGRQDNQNIWLLESDDLFHWEGGRKIITPLYPWELMQMGNCGSPIEIDEGWLVLTHGVGTVRTYCIGAVLLDRDDPARILARTTLPLVHPSPRERDGYVPNVVYSCGAMVHDHTLILPYGVADNFATFATVAIDDLLAVMR